MFKPLYEDLLSFLKVEPLNTPGFAKRVPADLVTVLRGLYSLGNDVDKYRTFIYNKDDGRIFIIYRDLIADANHAVINDVILYKGDFVHLVILDYDVIFGQVPEVKAKDVMTLIFQTVCTSVIHLKAKNVNFFYKSKASAVLTTVFSEAITILFIQIVRAIYGDTAELPKKLAIELLQSIEYSKEFDEEDYNDYSHLVDNNSIEFLLDCSAIALILNPKLPGRDIPDERSDEGEKNEEETLQRNPS